MKNVLRIFRAAVENAAPPPPDLAKAIRVANPDKDAKLREALQPRPVGK